mgnify:CR=1 FL=1
MTDTAVDLLEGCDPLGRDIPLPHALDAAVLGVPVRFESNSNFVIDVANESFGGPRAFAADKLIRKPLSVRVVVQPGGSTTDGEISPVRAWSPEKTWVILQGPDIVAVADALRGQSVAYVSRGLVGQRAQFRQGVLETLTFIIVSHHDRQPVHAASVGRGKAAVLLCAGSGTGKSTLAYAAHMAGLTVFSDEVTWVQLRPRVAVRGDLARRIYLEPEAREHFPWLALADATVLPSGKYKIPVDLGDPIGGQSLIADHVGVCLLERANGPTALTRVSAEEVVTALTGRLEPGFDRYRERLRACAFALAIGGGWRLAVSNEPSSAIPSLVSMLDGLGGARS